jgi:hypothetical protein
MKFGVKPNMPSLLAAKTRRKFYVEAKQDEINQTLLSARDISGRNNDDIIDESKEDQD